MNVPPAITALPQSAKLADGVAVFFRKTPPSGLLSVQVWVKTGSVHEAEFIGGGLSHYLEHMVFKGTEKFSAEELTRRVRNVGGNVNAYTTFSRTVFHVDVPAEAAETAFDVLAQLTLKPRLDPRDAEREKDVILREIDMCEDDPDSRLADATLAEAFRVHPYGVPVIGFKNVFARMSSRELETYFKRRYVPANIAVIVAGDAEAGPIFALAEKYFSGAEERPAPAPFVPAEPPQLAPREITLRGDVGILRGNVLWKIPDAAHEDAPALSALAAILGRGDSALLWRELHEERGLVHELDVSAWMPKDGGLFWIAYSADLGAREATEAALRETAARIAREGVAPALLEKAFRQAVASLVSSLGTASAAAERLGAECAERGDPAATRLFLEKMRALTPEKIRETARKYFRDETLTTSALEKPAPRKRSASRAGTATAPHAFPPFEEARLRCGARVLLQPVPGFPKVSLRVAMLGGGGAETPETRGAAALLSTLATLDAGTRTAAEIAEAIESVGGRFGETSGDNTLSLHAETLAGDEALAGEILGDAVCAPRFSEANFLRERATQLAALRGELDEIEEFARLALRREFFGTHPLAVGSLGTEETLAALSLADVEALRARIVVPANVVVAASGEFDRDALLARLEENFSPERFAAARDVPAGTLFSPEATPRKARELTVAAPVPAEQTIVQLAFPDVGFRDERYWVGALADELLSGMSSRLFLEVRERRGLAYFVGADRVGAPRTGMFRLCAGTEKAKAGIVLEEMRKELRRLREGRISAEELLGAKTRVRVARRAANQRPAARCGNAALNALYGLPVNRDAEAESRIDALTADDVARFATEVLAPEFSLAMIVSGAE